MHAESQNTATPTAAIVPVLEIVLVVTNAADTKANNTTASAPKAKKTIVADFCIAIRYALRIVNREL